MNFLFCLIVKFSEREQDLLGRFPRVGSLFMNKIEMTQGLLFFEGFPFSKYEVFQMENHL